MNIARNLFNTFKIIAGSGLASMFLLGSNILLARHLQPGAYGDYATAYTLNNGGMFIAVFGITQLMTQEYGRHNHFTPSFVTGTLIFLPACVIAACVIISIAALNIGISPQARDITLLLLPVLVAQAVADVSAVYFQIVKFPWLTGGWIAVLNFWRLIACAWFTLSAQNIHSLPISQSVGSTVFSIVAIWLIWHMLRKHSDPPKQNSIRATISAVRSVAKESTPYAVAGIMYYATSQLPLVLFATIAGPQATATYSVAYLIMSTFYFIPQMLMVRSLMMKYHRIATHEPEKMKFIYRQGTKLAGIGGAILALGCAFIIPFSIRHIFGNKYDASILITQIMLICLPLRFMTVNVAAVVVAGVSIWYKNFADIISGAFAVIVFSVLIHIYGTMGGAVAAVLAEMMYLGLHIYLVERFLTRKIGKLTLINQINE